MKKREQKRAFWLIIILLLLAIIFIFLVYKRPLVVGPLVAPENITIFSPSQTYYPTSSVILNVSLTDIVVQLNMTLNGVVSELCQNCSGNYTLLNLSDGNYFLTISAYNGESNASKPFNFVVDTVAPVIARWFPVAEANYNDSVPIQFELIESNFANITYWLYRVNETMNETVFYSEEWLGVAYLPDESGLFSGPYSPPRLFRENGTYLVNASVLDKAGNVNLTETRRFYVMITCVWDWVSVHSTCNSSDVNITSYEYLPNFCNVSLEGQGIGGMSNTSTCDYCIPQWTDQYTICASNLRTKYPTDSRNCYAQTGLASDLAGMLANETEECGVSPETQTNTPLQNITRNTTQPRSNATKIFLNESQISSGFIATLASNDVLEINFSGKHILKAVSILSSSLIIILDANSLPFFVDDIKDFDFDGDENPDMSIKVNSISGGRVSLLLRAIPRQNLTTVVQNNTVNETFEYADPGPELNKAYLITGIAVGALVLLAGVVFFIIWLLRSQKKEGKKVVKIGKTSKGEIAYGSLQRAKGKK